MIVELTPTKVQSVVQENTELSIETISRLGTGFDFDTFLVNDEWVFRFPMTTSAADAMYEEHTVLNGLSLPTAIPDFEHWLDRPFGYPLPVSAYRLIRGLTLESLEFDSFEWSQLAADLGNTLQSLHVAGDDRTFFVEFSSDYLSPEFEELVECDVIGLTANEKSSVNQFVRNCHHYKTKSLSARIHGDLGVEHIITNGQRQLVGLIDWSNTAYGNKFKDFVGLWGWGGDKFTAQVLSNYEESPRKYDWQYIRVNGLMYCFHRLKYVAASRQQDLSILRNRLRKRIAETSGMKPSDPP
ncbi:MAG: aminoglycoside phosphotransferase family protein [Gammaproteobacteria bacterium]|nr:aminoglycoside phosphotransferase family protein [Gammaproteobacteria bacterium]